MDTYFDPTPDVLPYVASLTETGSPLGRPSSSTQEQGTGNSACLLPTPGVTAIDQQGSSGSLEVDAERIAIQPEPFPAYHLSMDRY